ncbi:MAG: hypothetical protein M5R36_27320 [Deltaproteobacteria bacterium]|nr:hypothetical protein [Deltaproteobacteria bacterium]
MVGFGFTDGNGAALVNVFGEIRDGETLTATVTGHNLLPSIHELTVGESLPGGGDDDTGDENGDDDEAGTDNDDDGAANDSAPKRPATAAIRPAAAVC